jgi:hypothetical protein
MTWQEGTTSATGSYRDFAVSLTAIATSQHVSAATISSGGTGYAQGDLLTIGGATAYHDAVIEVLTVDGSGVIQTIRIRQGGAFANRAASATVDTAGSGYAVGDILEVQTGTATERAKLRVTAVTGGAIDTVAVFETGGAYSVAPSAAGATVGIGPAAFAGDDAATVTVTMTGAPPTSAVSASGGTGTGAAFNLTLTATGWSVLFSRNDATRNSVTDEKQVILQGTVGSGDAPIVGFTTYTQNDAAIVNRGLVLDGFDGFNAANAYSAQPGIGPSGDALSSVQGAYVPVLEAAREWYVSATARRLVFAIRTTDVSLAYGSGHLGLLNQFGSAVASPYPMFIAGCSNGSNTRPDDGRITGLSEALTWQNGTGPLYFRRKTTGGYVSVANALRNATNTIVQQTENCVWPVCELSVPNSPDNLAPLTTGNFELVTLGGFASWNRVNVSGGLLPTRGVSEDRYWLFPLTILSRGTTSASNDQNAEIVGEIDGAFWFGGKKDDGTDHVALDAIEQDGVRYRVFPCGAQAVAGRHYKFFLLREN